MRYYILLLLFISFFSYSQNKEIDSLKRVLTEYEKVSNIKNDTLAILTLQRIANRYITIRPDSAISFAQKSIAFCSQSIGYEKYLDVGYLVMGISYATKGFHESAIPNYYKGLPFSQKYHHTLIEGYCYKFIGDSFFIRNLFEKAQFNYQNALKKYQILGDSLFIQDVYTHLGNVYFSQKKYLSAFKYFSIGKESSNIGLSLMYLGKEKEGIKIVTDALKVMRKDYDYFQITLTNKKISQYYNQVNQPEKSNKYAIEAFNLSKKNNYNNEQMISSGIISQNYEKLGNKVKAFEYLKTYQHLKDIITDESQKELMNSLKFEYDLKIKQDELKVKTIDFQNEKKAKYYAIGMAILLVFILLLILFYNRRLSNTKKLIEEKNNNLEVAQSNLTELNQNLEQKVNERTSELMNANQELIQKNRDIQEAMFQGQTFERKQVATELHDNLGSQLSAMRWSILAMNTSNMSIEEKEIYENVLAMMDDSYTQIRNISHNLFPEELQKEGLKKTLEKLIHKLNRNQSITFYLNFSNSFPNLKPAVVLEIYAIILELINNIIRHSKATEASIVFLDTPQNLQIDVIDNGIGLDTDYKNGIGFKNIQERINKIGAVIHFEMSKGFHAKVIF